MLYHTIMQKIIIYRHLILWGLFFIFLPFSKALINITLLLGILVFFYDIFTQKSFLRKRDVPFFTLFILVVYLSIRLFIGGEYDENKYFYKLYPLLFAPYLVLKNTRIAHINLIKKISVYVAIVYVSICFIRMGFYSAFSSEVLFGNSEIVNKILMFERPYAGCFVLLNIILLWDFFTKTSGQKKIATAFGLIVLISFIVLIAARLSLLSLFLLSIIYILFYVRIKLVTKGLLIFGTPILASLFIFFSPGLQERLFIGEKWEVFKDYEPRFLIWDASKEIASADNFKTLVGVGNYQKIEDELVDRYEKIENTEKKVYYLKEKFNTHNQLIDFYLLGGVIALMLFVLFYAQLIILFRINFTSLAILLGMLLFLFVENIFHRQTGCYLFIIYLMLAYKINDSDRKLKPTV